MIPSDTSPRALAEYRKILAQKTPSERVRIGVALWDAANALQTAAIRREHPEASDEEVKFQIAASRFGLELARKAYRRS